MQKAMTIVRPRPDGSFEMPARASTTAPPDAGFFTSCRPTSSAASYVSFSPTTGQLSSFSFALSLRVTNFGNWQQGEGWRQGLGYVSSQRILTFGQGNNGGEIFIVGTPWGFDLRIRYANVTFNFWGVPETDKWVQIALTCDGKNLIAYVDGEASAIDDGFPAVSSPAFSIGIAATDPPARPPTGFTDGPFIGDVQSFFVWNIALTPSQVLQQMSQKASSPVEAPKLVLGCDFTTNPPTRIGTGPVANPVNTVGRGEATSLLSYGYGVAIPGEATVANPGGSAPFSLLGWINSADSLNGYIFSNGAVDVAAHMGLKLVDGKLVVEFGEASVSTSAPISASQWHYVALTYDGTNASIYVDKLLATAGRLSGTSPTKGAPVLFGALNGTGNTVGKFAGCVQFLSIWNKCLTAAEIAALWDEDPTPNSACVANFMCSAEPALDSIAAKRGALWGKDRLKLSQVYLMTTELSHTARAQGARPEPARPPAARLIQLDLGSYRGAPVPVTPSPVQPFSDEHKRLMVQDFADVAASMKDTGLAARWTEAYAGEVDRVFNLARTNPEEIDAPHVTVEAVDGRLGLFYHPRPHEKIDLGVRADTTENCLMWWIGFILTIYLGIFAILGVPTKVDDLTALATRIVKDPIVIETCTSGVGFILTPTLLLSFCKLLYDFGYLSQAFWLVASMIGWPLAGRLLVRFVGCILPVPTPYKVLFVANSIKLVAQLVVKFTQYPAACGNGQCVAQPS
jgi:Concanavalin A-like lectin/glucanases superfamily